MAYTSIQLGEILSLATYRTDDFFGHARFSRSYAAVLSFNLASLALVLYVPAISSLLELVPLTFNRLILSCIPAVLIMMLSEVIKIEYRRWLPQLPPVKAEP